MPSPRYESCRRGGRAARRGRVGAGPSVGLCACMRAAGRGGGEPSPRLSGVGAAEGRSFSVLCAGLGWGAGLGLGRLCCAREGGVWEAALGGRAAAMPGTARRTRHYLKFAVCTKERRGSSPLELDESTACAGITLYGEHGPVAFCLPLDILRACGAAERGMVEMEQEVKREELTEAGAAGGRWRATVRRRWGAAQAGRLRSACFRRAETVCRQGRAAAGRLDVVQEACPTSCF